MSGENSGVQRSLERAAYWKNERMPDQDRDLSDQLRARRGAAERTVTDSLASLQEVAGQLGLQETRKALAQTAAGLALENFNLVVMGRFKTGKSTLLNALLAGTTHPVDLGGANGPMVVDDLPATAVLTAVSYAEAPSVRAMGMDGKVEKWPLARYLHDSTLDVSEVENERRFRDIAEFQLGFPARLCQANVTIYDSPGLDESPVRTRITREVWKRCDGAILVYGSRALMGQGELEDDRQVRNDNVRVFVVVNLFGDRPVDDRLRALVWNRYVRDHLHGPVWSGQDLADYDIYFVNAKLASDARYGAGGQEAYERSGIAAFERRLGQFLTEERLNAHLGKFITQSLNLGDRLAQHVSQRQAAIQANQERLQTEWSRLQPRIVRLRATVDRIPKIVERYRTEAADVLVSSFATAVAGIRRELPSHMEAAVLPSAGRTFAVYQQKRLTQEAVDEINEFVAKRVADWSEQEAERYLLSLGDRLGTEISDEVIQLDREFSAINLTLTGWHIDAVGTLGNVHSTTERVAGAIAGLLADDLSATTVGGTGTFRGAAFRATGSLGTSWLLMGVLGITSGLVFVPVMLVIAALTGALSGGAGLVGRIKNKALESADERVALLPQEMSARLRADLSERFDELEQRMTDEVADFVAEQVDSLEQQFRISRGANADRDRAMRELAQSAVLVDDQRVTLKRTLASIK